MGNELSTKGDAIPAASSTLPARLYLGQPDEALAGMDKNRLAVDAPAAREGLRLQRPMFTLCLAHAGRLEEAQADMVQTLAALEEIGPLSDVPMNFLTQLLQVAVLTEDKEVAATLSRELRDASHLINGFCVTCVARHLGAASALLGRPDEARNYYAQALEVCKKVRFRPEIALIRLQLAELLLDQYSDERAEAIEHLDFAIGEFQGMKMQPSLERALRHRELLKA